MRVKASLTTYILIAMAAGVCTGLFVGEYCSVLAPVGSVFVGLLQMTVLPYLLSSLIGGIGSLSYQQARTLALNAGVILLALWGMGLAVILLMPAAFPHRETASFFRPGLVEGRAPMDLFEVYIPANVFQSLMEGQIPAVVLFSVAVGVALIGIKDKAVVLQSLGVLTETIGRLAGMVVRLTPVAVFAIAANAAGTMTTEELGQLAVYFATYGLVVALLAFVILPLLLTTVTPFRYGDVVRVSSEPLLTAFATANLVIVIPALVESCRTLLRDYGLERKESAFYVHVMVPVSFNFPSLGTLSVLLFVVFAGWISGKPLGLGEYPELAFLGIFALFGGAELGIPFLLDAFGISGELFKLYVLSSVVNGRLAMLLGGVHLITLTLIVTCAIGGCLTLDWKKLSAYAARMGVLVVGSVLLMRIVLGTVVGTEYTKFRVFGTMQPMIEPVPTMVYRPHGEVPDLPETLRALPTLDRITERGVLRVGYVPGNLPFAFFNVDEQLVGYDVDMANLLARELGCSLEFVALTADSMADALATGQVDIVMSGLIGFTDRFLAMGFSAPYLEFAAAFVVPDERRGAFASLDDVARMQNLRVGVLTEAYFARELQGAFPEAEAVQVPSIRAFFTDQELELDALLTAAEIGSAWTLLFPEFTVVVPQPDVLRLPVGYAVRLGDQEWLNLLNNWIALKKRSPNSDELYRYWIYGEAARSGEPRWSIMRNVLHLVD